MTRTGRPAHRHVASVARALEVLFALADAGAETGTNEISRRTGINASTVSRQLATLAASGLVEHVAETGRYRLGIRLVQLGNAVLDRLDLREVARPHLQALAQETEETVTLSAPGEGVAVTVDFVRSPASVQSVAQVGRPTVVHATATGKVMMAFGADAIPSGPFERYTPRTITDPDEFAAELEKVRSRGWAQAVGEREEDLKRRRLRGLGRAPAVGRDPRRAGALRPLHEPQDARGPGPPARAGGHDLAGPRLAAAGVGWRRGLGKEER